MNGMPSAFGYTNILGKDFFFYNVMCNYICKMIIEICFEKELVFLKLKVSFYRLVVLLGQIIHCSLGIF